MLNWQRVRQPFLIIVGSSLVRIVMMVMVMVVMVVVMVMVCQTCE